MGNLILLPNSKILMLNGAQTGTAGYGAEEWTIDESYADNELLMPIMYDPSAPQGPTNRGPVARPLPSPTVCVPPLT